MHTGCASFGTVIRDQLNENHFRIDDFSGSITDIIAPFDPFHLVSCFEIFSNIFLFGQSHYNVIEQCLRLQFNLYKIAVQCPDSEQIVIAYTVMLFQVPPVSLSPNTNLHLDLIINLEIRQIIITRLSVCATQLFKLRHYAFFHSPRVYDLEFLALCTDDFQQHFVNSVDISALCEEPAAPIIQTPNKKPPFRIIQCEMIFLLHILPSLCYHCNEEASKNRMCG